MGSISNNKQENTGHYKIPEAIINKILLPYSYLDKSGSKGLSRKTGIFLNQWLKCDESDLATVGDICHDFHQSTLLVDDIEDSSELRRGVPSSYVIYGAPLTMNASAYMMSDVTQRVLNTFRDPNVLLTFVKYVKFIHISQGMDLYYRDIQCDKDDLKEANIPTEEEYNKILVYKSAGQLMMMAALLGAKSKTGIDVVPLAQIIGHHFQIRDDYLNIMSKQYEEKKGFCDDLVEGKFSLPVIFALHLPNQEAKAVRLYQILRMHTKNRQLLEEALSILKDTGAICYVENEMRKLRSDVMKQLIVLGNDVDLTILMEIIGVNM